MAIDAAMLSQTTAPCAATAERACDEGDHTDLPVPVMI